MFRGSQALRLHSPRVVDPVVECKKTKVVWQDPILELELELVLVDPIKYISLWPSLPFLVLDVAQHNFQEALLAMKTAWVGTHAVISDH